MYIFYVSNAETHMYTCTRIFFTWEKVLYPRPGMMIGIELPKRVCGT